ncbi:MAG: hypothetical protein NT128_02070 [Proteobacteria bacterium]|nr:hypothetical protein [Pseudomonadota bacterium]
MNCKNFLSVIVFACMLFNAVQAASSPFGNSVKRGNPWMNPGAFNLSQTLVLTPENIKEIKGVEWQIKVITGYLQAIQEILGENFQDIGSTKILRADGLGKLQNLYTTLIKNYINIIGYFGSTDHYYLPLSSKEYEELRELLASFAKKADLEISVSDTRGAAGNTQWGG